MDEQHDPGVGLTAERVRRAARAWVYVPPTATVWETPEHLLVQWPPWWEIALSVLRFEPADVGPGELKAAVERVMARAAQTGLPEVVWWVTDDSPESLLPALRARGGQMLVALDVLACDLTRPWEADAPDVELRWAEDLATLREAHAVGAEVFGGGVPPDHDLERELSQERAAGSGQVVAYLDGRPVAAGGLTVATHDGGTDGRLWGGAVLPDARSRGLYRAVLAARMDRAREHGAALALVKGRVETSAPILRRVGFEVFGQETGFRVPLPR